MAEDGGGGDGGVPSTVGDATTGAPDSASTGNDASSTSDSAPPLQTCVHNSDCTAGVANLCQGNNGVACLGGFCIPTGKPENCDDGIACVNASCDANTNQCVFTPNDSACPTGSYCDPALNCVANLPCTPGDSVCDRLDTNACVGLWSCVAAGATDGGASYCVQASPPCQNIPNAATLCNGTSDGGTAPVVDGGAADLHLAMRPGLRSSRLDGHDLAAGVHDRSPPPDDAGCDCKFAETSDGGIAYDPPDLGFADSNCDGIDGTIAVAVFVDLNALTGGDGSMRYPFVTIGEGITAAQASGGAKTDVYVSKGIYRENVTMVNGVGIYGGYDASNKWSRALTTNTTLVASQTNVGVDVQNLTSPFNIQLFSVSSPGGERDREQRRRPEQLRDPRRQLHRRRDHLRLQHHPRRRCSGPFQRAERLSRGGWLARGRREQRDARRRRRFVLRGDGRSRGPRRRQHQRRQPGDPRDHRQRRRRGWAGWAGRTCRLLQRDLGGQRWQRPFVHARRSPGQPWVERERGDGARHLRLDRQLPACAGGPGRNGRAGGRRRRRR